MSAEWISFERAVTLLEDRYGTSDEALSALKEMLVTGAVRSLAGEIARYESSPAFGTGGAVKRRWTKRRIPAELWEHISLSRLNGSDWRRSSFWATCTYMHWGFSTSGGKNEIRHISYRLRFVDVDCASLEMSAPEGSSSAPRRGYREADKPLVHKMRGLVVDKGMSVTVASLHVAPEALGGGTAENRAKRLERLYVKTFGKA